MQTSSLHSYLIHNHKLAHRRHATYARHTASRTATITCKPRDPRSDLRQQQNIRPTHSVQTTNTSDTSLAYRSTSNSPRPLIPASTRGSRWLIAHSLSAHVFSSTSVSASAHWLSGAAYLSTLNPTSRRSHARKLLPSEQVSVAQRERAHLSRTRSIDLPSRSISSTHSTRLMGNRGDRCFYGGLLATVISFFCFSVYTGHSGDNPLHDFESKPKGSKGKSK